MSTPQWRRNLQPYLDDEVEGSQTIGMTGIASAEAIGQLLATLRLFPSGVVTAEGIGVPTVTPQAATLLLNAIASGEAVGIPTIGAGVTILLNAITSAFAAGTPLLQYRLTPVGIRPPGFAYSGYGSTTRGGDLGPLYRVTNTNDSGAGSLRDACSVAGRYIMFDPSLSGGTITLASLIDVRANTTIDGSTVAVPITIAGKTLRLREATIGCHDVILRYLRVIDSDFDNIQIFGAVYNIVIDHCTLYMSTGAADGNLDITEGAHDVTVSWCLLHKARLSSTTVGKNLLVKFASRRVSIHHCLFYATTRNPQVEEDDLGGISDDLMVDARNNVVWDWGDGEGSRVGKGAWANFVANFYSKGGGSGSDTMIVDTATDGRAYVKRNLSQDGINVDNLNTEEVPLGTPPLIFQETDACLGAELVLRDCGARSSTGTLPTVDQDVIDDVVMSVCTPHSGEVLDTYLQKNRSSEIGSPHVAALIVLVGVASGELLGTPQLNLRLFPNGVASAMAIGTPLLALRLLMNGVASGEAIGGPLVVPQAITLFPDAAASAEALGAPRVNLLLFPNGIASAGVLGTPTVSPQVVTVILAGIASAEAIGTPELSVPGVIALNSIASAEALGAPKLNLRLFPNGIASAEALGTPAVSLRLLLTAIASAEALGTPQLNLRLFLNGIASAGALGTPTVSPQAAMVVLNGIATAEALGTPQLNLRLLLNAIASAEALGIPIISGGGSVILPVGIASLEAIGTPLVLPQPIIITPAGIASAFGIGVPLIGLGVHPDGIPSEEVVSGVTVALGISPNGVVSAEAIGVPTLVGSAITLVGIPSAEAIGVPVLLGGAVLYPGWPTVKASGIRWVAILSGDRWIPIISPRG